MSLSNSSDSLTWIDQAKTYCQQEQYIEALNCIHQGLAIAPKNAEAWLQCGNILQKLGFYGDAITANHNAKCLLGSPEASLTSISLEDLLARAQKQPVSSIPPLAGDSAFWRERALACTRVRDYAAALAAYDKVLELEPDQAQDWYRRGLVLFYLRQYEDAIASFDQAVEHQPDFYQAWNNRASIQIQIGNHEEAILSYKQALRITDGQLWQAWEDLGMTVLHTQSPEAGIATWDEGIQALRCDAEEYALGCGSLHQRKGDIQSQEARQQLSPQTMWKAAKLSYLKALDLLNFQTFPQQHLEIWQSLLLVRFHLQETSAIHAMLLEAAIKLQTLEQDAKLSPEQILQIEQKFVGFQQIRVDWLVQQNQLTEAILQIEHYQDQTLGCWRFGPDYKAIQPQYADIQSLLNQQRAILYWHISPTALSTFLLKYKHEPILLGSQPLSPKNPQQDEKVPSSTEQQYRLQSWQKNWQKTQQRAERADDPSRVTGAGFWLRGQATQLLNELKEILAIDILCETALTDIQEIILVTPRRWREIPLPILFPEHFNVTLLPSLQIGLNLLQPEQIHKDHLLNIVPPSPSDFGGDSHLAELEAMAIARTYNQHIQLSGQQLTQKTLMAALKISSGRIHFTGLTAPNGQSLSTTAWHLTDEYYLTLSNLFELDWQSYSMVCMSGGPQTLNSFSRVVPDLETCLLTLGVQHVLSSLWSVNHCSRILLMAHFHHLLHQNCNPAHALKQAQHWLRNLTCTETIQWWETLAETLETDQQQAAALVHIKEQMQSAAQEIESDFCPFSHPWHWAGLTISGNFPEILVWNKLS